MIIMRKFFNFGTKLLRNALKSEANLHDKIQDEASNNLSSPALEGNVNNSVSIPSISVNQIPCSQIRYPIRR